MKIRCPQCSAPNAMSSQYCEHCGQQLDEAGVARRGSRQTVAASKDVEDKTVIQRVLDGWVTILIGAVLFAILSAFQEQEWGITALVTCFLIGIARETTLPFLFAVSQSKWAGWKWIGWKIIIWSLAAVGLFFLVENWLNGSLV